ncbi:tripartite tricarboxylate transporter substrate binding protein [Comamonas testosteroni]|uniref:tripartite tricarboxylate transporter substrate binding protein n=1 Tax=Comamonas testosteroni TaxID=285 RepID=UPI00389B1259
MHSYLSGLRRRGAIAMMIAVLPLASWAAWPDRPIRMVVPYAAGGGADNTARIVAQRLGEILKQPVVIDNRPGAGGVIGAEAIAKAAPDGYNVLYDASAFGVNGALRKLPYDPAKDFIPVTLVATAPQILVVSSKSPFKSVADLIATAKKTPGRLTYASAGAGTGSHLAAEMFNDQARIETMHVPYKGGAPALTDVMAGQVDMYFGNAASTLQYTSGGKLRALAVSSRKHVSGLESVPTLRESGLPEFEVLEWNGVFLPKNTPKDIVDRLAKATRDAIADSSVRERLLKMGLDPVGNTPEEFGSFIKAETTRWHAVVKSRHITLD